MENILYCKNCDSSKIESEFNKCNSRKTGRQAKCRECEKKYKSSRDRDIVNEKARINYQSIKDKESIRRKKYYEENKALVKQKAKDKYDKNQRHERYVKNKENVAKYGKEYRKNNLEQCREYQRNWTRNQRKINPHYKIRQRLQGRIRVALIRGKGTKFCPTMEITGISLKELKIHLEKQFTEGMTWEKFMSGEIEIDHIKPCCSFDLTNPEEQKKCFHYTNLRPFWSEDNKNKIKEDLKQKFIKPEQDDKYMI